MVKFLAYLALIVAASPAVAQSWASADFCRVDTPEIHESAFGPDRAFIEQRAANTPNGTGRLWQITAPNGAVSHLWGTFHSNDPTILNLPRQLRDVLAQARVVAGELDPIPKSRRDMDLLRADPRLYREAGRFSLAHKPAEAWVNDRLVALGYGNGSAHYLTDLGLAEALLGDPCDDFRYGVFPIQDDRILLLGADAGAQLAGLEPRRAFRDTLSRDDRAATARAIVDVYSTYLNPDVTKEDRATGFALYLQGRIGMMQAWDTAYMISVFGDARAAGLLSLTDGYLVKERNHTFLQAAKPMLDGGRAVLAVGAFHLPGTGGMVDLLRRAGYAVERVVTDGEIP